MSSVEIWMRICIHLNINYFLESMKCKNYSVSFTPISTALNLRYLYKVGFEIPSCDAILSEVNSP